MYRLLNITSGVLIFIFCLLLCSSCEKEKGIVVRINQDSFSPVDQQEIGDAIQHAVDQNALGILPLEMAAYTEVYNYLNTHLQTISNTAVVENRLNYKWQTIILDTDSLRNAFTGPGGYFYITTAMLKMLKGEHELLALMGHEIMYTDQNYVIYALKDKYGGDILADILLGNDVPQIRDIAKKLSRISYNERDVMAADTFALEILCPFNYDAFGMQSLLRNAEQVSKDLEVDWLTYRDAPIDLRIEGVLRKARNCGEGENKFEERYQQIISKLP